MKIKILKDAPTKCIHCGSDYIAAGHFDGESFSRQVSCGKCDRSWFECFKFTGIIVDEDDEN